MKGNVLVTGAAGAIGPVLVQLLLKRGYQVRVLDQQQGAPALFPPGVPVIVGDINDRLMVDKAVEDVDVVFHLAAKLHLNNPPPEVLAEYRRVNVEGTRTIAQAARAAGVKRLVLFSTINVYGPSQPGQLLDEDSPLRPESLYAHTKCQAEQIALAEVPTVVLRLAAVYGPNMKGNYPRLLEALRRGRFVWVGDGTNRRTLVHVRDVCAAAVLAAERPEATGKIYNVTDGTVHTLREIVETICGALGRKPPRLRIPAAAASWAAALADMSARCLLWRQTSAKAAVQKLTEDIAVRGERIVKELGFRPQYDLVRGWHDTVFARGSAALGASHDHFCAARDGRAGAANPSRRKEYEAV